MHLSRRAFVAAGAAGSVVLLGGGAAAGAAAPEVPAPPAAATPRAVLKVGAMEGVVGGGGAKALEAARRLGIDGVEMDAGGPEDTLRVTRKETIDALLEARAAHGTAVSSICMGLLNGHPLIREPRAPGWISAVIDAAAALDARVILLACFGEGTLRSRGDMEKAAAILKDLAAKATAKGVTLGLENTLSAKDNIFVLDRAGRPEGLRVYYDVGNATHYGYDVTAEIRELGPVICQIHFKDYKSGLLGRGEVKMAAVAQAMADIDYQGWVVLETGGDPLGRDLNAAVNAGFLRGLFARWTGV